MIIYQIEIEARAGLNKGQPFRRLMAKTESGQQAIRDQDSVEYRQAQANIASQMKGDVCIAGPIGFGFLLLSALDNLAVKSVTIASAPTCKVEEQVLAIVESHHKFKGFAKDSSNENRFDRTDVKKAYAKILSNKQKPKKRIGKFI